ncbi:response regulator [Serpentinicella sp. ANB-PHB4]|uniref:response regulator n=1 Tax=Serpentinicella sp. ANB-PHB4 TaxID=3074076 RepID=UPI00285580C5|nr:response regulator [Serpentinicella sp. ANB-PHB4]MDR5658482.1 response regulator [Serpentinicella sp. ANB-PHB4]
MKILLVEDDKVSQKIVYFMMKKKQWLLDIASNGEEAITLTRNNLYDAILMDLHLEDMNGFEVVRKIKKENESLHKNTPIFAMTAGTSIEDKIRCIEAGMQDCLYKPINPELLYSILERLTNKNAHEQMDLASLNNALALLGGSKELLIDLITYFTSNEFKENVLDKMESMINKTEYAALKEITHKLKGTTAYIKDISPLYELVKVLENTIKEGSYESIPENYNLVKKEYEAVSIKLSAYLQFIDHKE